VFFNREVDYWTSSTSLRSVFSFSRPNVMKNQHALVLASALLIVGLTTGCDVLSGGSGGDYSVVDIPAPGDVSLSDSLRAVYRTDAGRLALRRVQEEEGKAAQQVRLPDPLVESLYNALLHVHASEDLDGRDTVVEQHRIHTYPTRSVHEVSVTPEEPPSSWIDAWKAGQRLTGNGAVDRLLREYDLQLHEYNVYSQFESARLRSETPLNTLALSDRFEGIGGVKYADPGGFIGDGNDIEATLSGNFVELGYSVGFGDCPAGCGNRHYWTFRVFESGRVAFRGESGDPLPLGSVEQ
jgi:hypothetical protein